MKYIPVKSKHVGTVAALVDDEDYDRLIQYKWTLTKDGYPRRHAGYGSTYSIFMHHDVIGEPPSGMITHHKNQQTLDNTRENLEHVTRAHNAQVSRLRNTNTSGFRGVRTRYGKFQAMITQDYVQVSLGMFDTIEEAARAYDLAALKLFGLNAQLNFPLNLPE